MGMLEKITPQTLKKAVFYSWIAAAVIQLAELAVIFADQVNEISHKPGRNMIASAVIAVFLCSCAGIFRGQKWKATAFIASLNGFMFQKVVSMEYTVGTAGIIIKFVSGAGMLIFLLITLLAVENLMQDIDQRGGQAKKRKKFF